MDYITITRNTWTGLVVAIGGDEQEAGVLQAASFTPVPRPCGGYHRLPHHLPIAQRPSQSPAASTSLSRPDAASATAHADRHSLHRPHPDAPRERTVAPPRRATHS
ncbi:hypothetical protein ACFYM5_10415 [Streptomyces sp. NPDC006706]|uniref:hypothetical protein n=1 Tax=Streptomyces sp. NPDC006706 TaxID=3364761 RepID=UPI0036D19F7A